MYWEWSIPGAKPASHPRGRKERGAEWEETNDSNCFKTRNRRCAHARNAFDGSGTGTTGTKPDKTTTKTAKPTTTVPVTKEVAGEVVTVHDTVRVFIHDTVDGLSS